MDGLKTGLDYLPVRGIDHDRPCCDIGLAGKHVKEYPHFGNSVEQAVVHVYIYHLSTVLDLLTCYLKGFGVVLLVYQAKELARTGYIATLTCVHEVHVPVHHKTLQTRQPQLLRLMRRKARRDALYHWRKERNELVCSSATAAYDIDKPLIDILLDNGRHFGRRLVIAAQFVRKAGIGIHAYIERSYLAKAFQERLHLLCSE